MFEDEEEIHFEIKRGEVVSLDIVGTRLPWEFSIADKKRALLLYLDELVVPEERIGLQRDLELAGIPYFDMDMILKKFNGYTIQSH